MPRTSVISAFINDNASGGGGASPDGTQYYVELTVQSSQVSSDLTNFPVYVDLSTMPADFFTNVQSDGGDIRVTESDGTTRCPVDLVSIDTSSSTGELHFLASSLLSSSNTTFRIYYGTTVTSNQPGVATTYGRNAVWTDYAVVYHGNDFVDSTGNGNTLTASGTPTSGNTSPAKIGDSFEFDGSGALIASDNASLDITGDMTLTTWLYPEEAIIRQGTLLGKYDSETNDRSFRFRYGGGDSGVNETVFTDSGTLTPRTIATSAGITAATSWYYYVSVVNVSVPNIQHYVNAVSASMTQSESNATSVYSGAGDLSLGNVLRSGSPNDNVSTELTAHLDEVRLRTSLLSADWISAEYTNQNTPTTFYTVGSQTDV